MVDFCFWATSPNVPLVGIHFGSHIYSLIGDLWKLKRRKNEFREKKGVVVVFLFFFVSLIWCGGFDIWESCDEWCGVGIWNTKKYQLVELQIDWMISRTTPQPHKLRHGLEETMENQGPQKSQDAFIENRSKHSTYQWKP